MKAILLRRPGGPEALECVEVPTPVPGEGTADFNVSAFSRHQMGPAHDVNTGHSRK